MHNCDLSMGKQIGNGDLDDVRNDSKTDATLEAISKQRTPATVRLCFADGHLSRRWTRTINLSARILDAATDEQVFNERARRQQMRTELVDEQTRRRRRAWNQKPSRNNSIDRSPVIEMVGMKQRMPFSTH
jgi:hypothetical protein